MLSGVLVKSETRQHRLQVSGSGSYPSGGQASWEGSSTSRYFVDYVNPAAVGVYLYASSGAGTGANSSANLEIPALGVDESWASATLYASLETYVQFDELRLIMLSSGRWRIEGSDIHWYVDGSLVWSRGATFQITSGMYPMPAAIPLFGVPPELTGNASAGPVGFLGCSGVGTGATASGTVEGGWRYDRGDGWVTPPVAIPSLPLASGSPSTGSVGGTNTWNCSATTSYTNTLGGDFIDTGAWIMALPNLAAGVEQVGDDYRALLVRYGFPAVYVKSERSTSELNCSLEDTGSSAGALDTPVLPGYSGFLGIADGSGSTDVEEPFGETCYAPCGVTGDLQDSQASAVVITSAYAEFGPHQTATGDELTSLVHSADWRAAYVNIWGCPGWSYFPWFPDDAGGYGWEAFGSDVSGADYWIPNRQQMLDHPSLDPADALPGQRTHLISDLVTQNGLAGLLPTGLPAWWGVSRFEAQPWADYLAATLALDSADLASFPGGSGTGGATITLDAGTTVCELLTADWDIAPHRAAEAPAAWEIAAPTNASSWQVQLVGYDGAAVVLCASAGTYPVPHDPGRRGMSTTVQDFGAGYAADVGVDARPARMLSGAIMSDSALIGAPGLLPLRQGVRLRLTVVPTNPANPVTWAAPIAHLPNAADLRVVPERASACSIISADGPATRWGDQSGWNYFLNAEADPPIVRGVAGAMTAWDWLTLRRRRLDGVDRLLLIDTEIAALFVSGEEYTQRAHLARDPDVIPQTLACIVQGASGPATWIVNSFRETPPLVTFPNGERDGDFAPDYSQANLIAYSAATARMNALMPAGASEPTGLRLYAASPASTDLFDASVTLSGWLWRWHRDNTLNDAAAYRIGATWASADRDVHSLRRWRGGLYVPPSLAALPASLVGLAVHPSGMHMRAYVKSGNVYVGFRDNAAGASWSDSAAGIIADCAACAWQETAQGLKGLLLAVGLTGARLYYSENLGDNWTMATSFGTPTDPLGAAIAADPDGRICCYWLDGSDVNGRVLDTAFNVVRSSSSVRSGVDAGALAAAGFVRRQTPLIGLLTIEGGAVTLTESPDGINFS